MKRLYYLADNLHTCQRVALMLREAGVSRHNFHVISKDEIGLYLHRIHAASVYQQHDVVHSGERCALAGGAAGALLGVIVYVVQPLPWALDGSAVLVLILAGALAGAWQGALSGLSRDSYKIAPFRPQLDAGRHLIMVDVGDHNRSRVRELMSVRFPSVEFSGRDSTLITPFPRSRPV